MIDPAAGVAGDPVALERLPDRPRTLREPFHVVKRDALSVVADEKKPVAAPRHVANDATKAVHLDGDLALRLNQLKFYLRTVANAVLDHKMHCTDLSDDEALRFLMEGAYQSEGEARLKIIRAKQSSVQLSTYFVGRTAFYRLRQEIQREMGDAFDLGRYHEAVLDHGSVPVKYLPELTRERLKKER